MLKNIASTHLKPDVMEKILSDCCPELPPCVVTSTQHANSILEKADFKLITAIKSAQRSFCITDPSLPDNPIVFARLTPVDVNLLQADLSFISSKSVLHVYTQFFLILFFIGGFCICKFSYFKRAHIFYFHTHGYLSQGFLDLTKYTLDQVLGKNCRFLQGPRTDPGQIGVIRKGLMEGKDVSVCLINYKSDGSEFYNQLFIAGLRDQVVPPLFLK